MTPSGCDVGELEAGVTRRRRDRLEQRRHFVLRRDETAQHGELARERVGLLLHLRRAALSDFGLGDLVQRIERVESRLRAIVQLFVLRRPVHLLVDGGAAGDRQDATNEQLLIAGVLREKRHGYLTDRLSGTRCSIVVSGRR